MIDLQSIREAAARIGPVIRRTPLMRAAAMAERPAGLGPGAELWMKLECLQLSGSFKARGASNAIRALPPEALARGVVTASGGNHGLAVATVALSLGVPAAVFLPASAAPAKLARLRRIGADVRVVGTVFDEAEAAARAHAEATGARFIHPFAAPEVVAGQGTLALELLEDLPAPDAVLIGIGGGGLIGGMATALKALSPGTRVIGVEPVGAPTLHAALAAGRVVRLPEVTTRVATLAARATDPDLFAATGHLIDEVVLVEDADLAGASRWLWQEFGLTADLSGAAACAALRSGAARFGAGQKVVALVCGAGPEGTEES